MITITKMQFALIAAVASIMTTAMYAFLQALYSMGYDLINSCFFVIGRIIGDIPLMLICFVLAYILAIRISNRASQHMNNVNGT